VQYADAGNVATDARVASRTPVEGKPIKGPFEQVFGPIGRAADGADKIVFGSALIAGAGVVKGIEGVSRALDFVGVEGAGRTADIASRDASTLARNGAAFVAKGAQTFASGLTFGAVPLPSSHGSPP